MDSPLEYLKYLCTRERAAEEDEWRKLLDSPISSAIDDGYAVEAQVISDTCLEPLTLGYRFRDTDKVSILPGNIDETTRLTNVIKQGQEVFLEGIDDSGDLILSNGIRSDLAGIGKVFVTSSGPLLDYYDWQRSVLERWLQIGNPGAAASSYMDILNRKEFAHPGTSYSDTAILNEVYSRTKGDNYVSLIQGPPGCGKTHLISDVIALAVKENRSVGIFTFTNRACDQVLKMIASNHRETVSSVYRKGNVAVFQRDLRSLGIGYLKAINPAKGIVIGSTLYQLTRHVHGLLEKGSMPDPFDLLIIDEASQATLPMIAPPWACARHILLVGDQKQLPPLLHTSAETENEKPYYQSAFEYMVNRMGYIFLDKTRRMRKAVCQIPSKGIYDGKLDSHSSAEIKHWPAISKKVNDISREIFSKDPGQQLIIVPPDKNREGKMVSRREAELVANIILGWQNQMVDIFKEKDEPLRYVISCFYRAQVAIMRDSLVDVTKTLKRGQLHVDSVERNQGQTCMISFLSIGEQGIEGAGHGMNWRFDPRRLNVAITRARIKSYILASKEFVEIAISRRNPSDVSMNTWNLLSKDAINI
jgi:hypothetical protein